MRYVPVRRCMYGFVRYDIYTVTNLCGNLHHERTPRLTFNLATKSKKAITVLCTDEQEIDDRQGIIKYSRYEVLKY